MYKVNVLQVCLIKNKGKRLTLHEILVVMNFSDVFPYNFLGLPQNREIEFTIEL